MNLPTSVTEVVGHVQRAGSAAPRGCSTRQQRPARAATQRRRRAVQPAPYSAAALTSASERSAHAHASTAPALQREQALRPLLDEDDDEAPAPRSWRAPRPTSGSRNLLTHAQAQRGVHGAGELADAAQHDDHERVDDVALAEVGADVADLRQRAAGEAGDAGAQAEGQRVDARRAARRRSSAMRAVLRDAAHEQAEARAVQQQPHQHQHEQRRSR